MLKETKDLTEMVTTEDQQHIVPKAEKIKTGKEQTERKASTTPVIKSLTEPDPPKRKEPMLAQTEELKDAQLKRVTSKRQTSKIKKGKEDFLSETSQIEEVPLKSEVEVQSEVRGDEINKVTDAFIPTEEQKTKKTVFKKLPIEQKEKQEQQQSIKGKSDDVQSKIQEETVEDTFINVTELERTERTSSISPTIKITHKESLKAGDGSETAKVVPSETSQKQLHPVMDTTSSKPDINIKPSRTAEIPAEDESSENIPLKDKVAQKETRQNRDKIDKIKIKEVQSKTDEQRDKLSPNVQPKIVKAEDKIPKVSKTEEQKQRERKAKTVESEYPQEPQQKFAKPQEILVEQDQQNVSRVKDKTFKVTSIKETKPEQIERKVSVQPFTEETSEELEVAPKKHAENQESEYVTANKETEESESISQEESISLKERRQMLSKTKEAADEQIQSQSVTVENKIVKVTPIEDGTPKIAEQLIERKVSGASEVEVQVPHTKHLVEQDTQKTGKEGIPKSEARYSKEETQKIKRLQKLPKTGDKIEEEFQTGVLIKEQTPLTEDENTKQEQEYLLRQTEPEETVKGDMSVSLKKDEAQKDKRPKSAESKEITVKEVQARTVTVTEEYGNVTPLEATNVQQEQAEIMSSVVPAVKDAAKKHLTIKDDDVKTNIPQQMISADDVVKDVSLRKEKEVEGEIGSKLISAQSKRQKVSPIGKKTLKRREQIEITASSTTEPEVTYEKSDVPEKYAETKRTDEDKDTGKRDVSEFETTHPKKEKTLTKREEKSTKTVKEIQPIRDSKKDKTDKIVERSPIDKDGDSLSDPSKQIPVKQAKNKEDIVKDKREKSEGKRSVSGAAQPEVTHEHTLIDKHPVTDQTSTVLPAEEMETRHTQIQTKTALCPVMKGKDLEDISQKKEETKTEKLLMFDKTSIEDIQTEKSLREKGQRSDKVTRIPLKEVQSETVTVKDEYESVAPINVMETKQEQVQQTASIAAVMDVASEKHLIVKEGDVKSDTLQRFMSPEKLVKDIASKKEDIYESSEVLLVKHSQSPESSKKSVEVLAEKQKITDKTDRIKFVDDTMPSKQKQTQQNTQEILGEDAKTEVVVRDHPRKHEEVRYDRTKKADSLKDHGKVTVEGVQSKTDTVKDAFLTVSPNVETKQEQIERNASRTPVMDVAHTKPLIVKEQDIILETPQKYISPDDLFKDIPSRKTEAYESEDVKKDKSRLKLDQAEAFKVGESKSKVEILGEKTTKVLPESTAKALQRGQDTAVKVIGDTQTEILRKTLRERDETDTITEGEVQSTIVSTTVSFTEGTQIKMEHIKSKSEVTSRESLIADDRTEKCTKREILKDRITKRDQIKTMSAEQDFKDEEERPKTITAKVSSVEEMKVKRSLLEEDALERQLTLVKSKEIKTETILGKDKIIKEVQEKEEIKATGQQQIKGDWLVVPRKRNEMYQETVEVKVSDKNIPSSTESKSDIDLKPTVREPSVTGKTKLKTTDSPEYEQVAARKQEPEVERSLKADIRSFPPQEAETISSRKGEAQGLQSIIETRVLSLEPEGVALQDSSRGIEGKSVMCHRARVFDLSTKHRCAPPRFFTLLRIS
ncbi:titin-like [Anarrhichthys ocellatus]|uniref:titin-like n=1 Tax=Anarrhichthys ocellatus TaxID=433405 RepID=UPI0012EEA3C9|nr:titin-like [Anarrhichthys ocellatus]